MVPASAAALIAAKKAQRAIAVPPELLAELRALCEYNDKQHSPPARVGMDEARAMLLANGVDLGVERLQRVCKEQLGRKSWAQK